MTLRLFKIFLFGFFVLAAPAHGATTVTANITGNTTWTEAGSPYVVGDSHAITAGATLTIEPGVVVKFGYNCAQFYVAGGAAINAIGTAEKPIYFTSISDDTVGGDTNGDGSATIPSEASWIHMFFDAGSSGNFDHAVIRYAGGSNCQYKSNSALYNAGGGTLTVSNSEFYKNVAGMRMLAGTANVSNSDFHDQGSGILLQGGNASVSNSNFHNHIGSGIEANKGVLNLTENSFTDNLRSAARISGAVDFAHSRNTASNNGYDAFEIYSIISNDQAWNKDLVYVLSDITVAAGKTLSVGPGVIMKMRTVSDQFMVIGRLLAQGTADEKIYFTSIADDTVGGDTNGDGSATSPKAGDWVHIFFLNTGSTGEFSNAVIRYAGSRFYWNHTYAGIASFADSLSLSETELTDNSIYGIIHREGALNVADSEIARHSEAGIRSFDGEVNVSNSSLHDNQSYGINNSGPNLARAENNWWGNQSGPYHPILNLSGLGNRVSNQVDFDPWLGYDPTKTLSPPEFEECCSSVLFLPGLEASRLYRPGEDQVWEPTRNQDVEELYLFPSGESIDTDIYTRDIIDEAPRIINGYNVYKKFINFMDEDLVGQGIIKEWKLIPYDWRLDFDKILASGKKIGETDGRDNLTYLEATTTPLIFQELARLAENSDTGEVTIITHSNGGLLAKYLLNQLEDENHPYHALLDKIDKIIMVAAPQAGTPGAIEGLLHGDEQQFGAAVGVTDWGMIVDEERARELAENMQSAYNLLPSEKYFDLVQSPTIKFDSSVADIYNFPALYGNTIDSVNELTNFLLGDPQTGAGRGEPASDDEESPNVLKPALLSKSAGTHNTIDNWVPPAGMKVIQIAGWGIKTLSGIEYFCGYLTCSSLSTLDRDITKTHVGDGTVVLPSAVAMDTAENVERYYVDISEYNRTLFHLRKNRDHASILEIDPLRDFIKNLIQGDKTLTAYITENIPAITGNLLSLDYTIHSPVDIHIYDSEGNHTGLIPNPLPDSDLRAYEAKLPNSYYWEYGEVKYTGSDASASTTIKLIGTDLGTFTFDISETLGDEIVASTTFKDIPVAAGSILTMEIQNLNDLPKLQMDADGDGVVDTAISPGEGVTPQELIAILKGIIKTLELPKKKEEKLIKKIEKLEKTLEKEYKNEYRKKQKIGKAFDRLIKEIEKLEKRKVLTHEEAAELIEIVEKLRDSVVE